MTPLCVSIPEDVERLIIEAAMEDYVSHIQGLMSGVPALFTTCRKFKAWSYPIFYRSIILGDPQRIELLERTLVASPSLALLVRILVFPNEVGTVSQAAKIIAPCTGLTRLFYARSPVTPIQGCDFSTHTSLVRVGCDPSLFGLLPGDRPPPNSPIMQITHLDIFSDDQDAWYPTIAHLVTLSHLFILVNDLSPDKNEVSSLLPCLPSSLQVCILCSASMTDAESLSLARPLAMGEIDPRIVVALDHFCATVSYPCIRRRNVECLDSEWGMFHTRLDFWEEAEVIIHTRSDLTRKRVSTTER